MILGQTRAETSLPPLCPRSGEGADRGGFCPACRRQGGFNLIELMVAIVILAILVAIAYPLYTGHVAESRRASAITALQHAASLEEKHFAVFNAYAPLNQIGYAAAAVTVPSPQKAWYLLRAISSPTAYTLTATRNVSGPQADDECGDFVLNSNGQRSVINGTESSSECWGG